MKSSTTTKYSKPWPKDRWTKTDIAAARAKGWALSTELLLAGAKRKVLVHKIIPLRMRTIINGVITFNEASPSIVLEHVFNHAFYATTVPGLPAHRTYARVCMKAIRLCCLKMED